MEYQYFIAVTYFSEKREYERHGKNLFEKKDIQAQSKAFLEWAEKYDDISFKGRNIIRHKKWIALLNCSIIEIKGDLTNEERVNIVLERIKANQNESKK